MEQKRTLFFNMGIKRIAWLFGFLFFYFFISINVFAQTSVYKDGSLEVNVTRYHPCDGLDNGYITFEVIKAFGGQAT
ncbi:MAG: hypothetical protein OEX02_05950, partial [Cyclobacteriaceae bacterium]|nr:hypothetical protein [Cyclobacteriaceae bacterium]